MPLDFQQSPKPLRERVRHFTPAWHAVNTGTGAVAALFHVFPYGSNHSAMQYTALSFELLNLFLFVVLSAIGIARYTIFRGIWASMLRHPVQSLYLGCFPMGLSNLIVGAAGTIYGYFHFGGTGFLYALWGLWWLDIIMSIGICFGQLHIMFTRQSHEVHLMSLVWLLPIVTMVVAASAGVDVANYMIKLNASHVCLTLAISFSLVTIGTILSFSVLTIYIYRLIVHGLPEGLSIFSAFLPLGALGQAGYAYLLMGEISRALFPLTNASLSNLFSDDLVPRFIYFSSWMCAFTMWSFATSWFLLAVLALGDTPSVVSLPFTIMFWGTMFPNGAYARLTIILANSFDSTALKIWGSIYSCFVFSLWILAMSRSIIPFWDGSLFDAADLTEPEEAELMGVDPPDKEEDLMQTQTQTTTSATTIAEAV